MSAKKDQCYRVPDSALEDLLLIVNKLRKNRVRFNQLFEGGLDLAWLNIALKELKFYRDSLKEI